MKTDRQRIHITAYVQNRFSAEPEFLWAKYPNYAVFRHPSTRKWFAVFMDVPKSKLGLPGDGTVDILDVRCSELMIGSLLSEKGFLPAYHMNKNTWISILLDDSVPDEQIYPLLEMSFDAVAPKGKKPSRKSG